MSGGPRRFKRYPAYEDSGVEWLGEIPRHWTVTQVRSLASAGYKTFTDGDWIESPFIRDEGVRLIQTGNIGVGSYKEQGFRYVSEETFRLLRCTEILPGDVLICRLADPVGRACRAPDLGCRMITSVDVCILKPALDVDASFVVYALSAPSYLSWLDAICRGGTRDRVSRSMLGALRIQKPPLKEQRSIAAFLDRETVRLDALVAKKKRLIGLLQERRSALITRAVTKGLNPNATMKHSGVDSLGEIPIHWDMKAYKHVCERVFVGIAEAATFAYVDEGVPLLRSTDVRSNRIRTDDIRSIDRRFADRLRSKMLRTGDIVTVRTGNAGVSAVVPPEYDGGQCFTLVVSRPLRKEVSKFLSYALNSEAVQSQFAVEGMGTAQINISVPIVQNTQIAVPPIAEQQQIADWIDAGTSRLDALIARTKEAVCGLIELRTALISAAVTGKIDVREEVA